MRDDASTIITQGIGGLFPYLDPNNGLCPWLTSYTRYAILSLQLQPASSIMLDLQQRKPAAKAAALPSSEEDTDDDDDDDSDDEEEDTDSDTQPAQPAARRPPLAPGAVPRAYAAPALCSCIFMSLRGRNIQQK